MSDQLWESFTKDGQMVGEKKRDARYLYLGREAFCPFSRSGVSRTEFEHFRHGNPRWIRASSNADLLSGTPGGHAGVTKVNLENSCQIPIQSASLKIERAAQVPVLEAISFWRPHILTRDRNVDKSHKVCRVDEETLR